MLRARAVTLASSGSDASERGWEKLLGLNSYNNHMATPDVTIDASGEKLGRVASRAAKILMGKHLASYTPHIRSDVALSITNASKMHIPQKKRQQKMYMTYSGHPGGLKKEDLAHLAARKGHREVLRRAIERMLPRNAMRTPRLKLLQISE